jgi:uncharacterized metal-binding protein YceD (DUF177 family)
MVTPMPDNTSDTAQFPVAGLNRRKPTRFAILPDAAGRARLAEDLGILGIDALRFAGEITPKGRTDWDLTATMTATVVQACVVTLEPVRTKLSEQVLRRYLAEMPVPEGEEVEMPEDDSAEPLPRAIDAYAVMTEALLLALPPWPRAKGAEVGVIAVAPPGAEPLEPGQVKPFAGLAQMMKKPDGTPPDGSL